MKPATAYPNRAGLAALALALLLPAAVMGQGTGAPFAAERPRALVLFEDITGYGDLIPERFGTPAQPQPSEMGMLLVLRMFRTVCLGIERGAPLQAVMPEGFASYGFLRYAFGEEVEEKSDNIYLSATGSEETDQIEGRPSVLLNPDPRGMSCSVNWQLAQAPAEDRAVYMAGIVKDWMPWELALVLAEKPMLAQTAPIGAHEWDRPCAERWCPTKAFYSLTGNTASVTLETFLNITDVEGERP